MLHVKAIYWAYIDNIRIDIRRKCVSLFLVCNPLIILCQTSFDMTYKEGNYFITSSMNNHGNVEIFVESGLPGVLINEHNYNRLFVDSLYECPQTSKLAKFKQALRCQCRHRNRICRHSM